MDCDINVVVFVVPSTITLEASNCVVFVVPSTITLEASNCVVFVVPSTITLEASNCVVFVILVTVILFVSILLKLASLAERSPCIFKLFKEISVVSSILVPVSGASTNSTAFPLEFTAKNLLAVNVDGVSARFIKELELLDTVPASHTLFVESHTKA